MLDEIRAFVVLAESGSLQRAAARLFLTPSAVTRQIQRLEAALKTPLLDRRVKPGRITREGHVVLDRGRQMLRIMDEVPGVVGMKQSGGDLKSLSDLLLRCKPDNVVLSGIDAATWTDGWNGGSAQ